MKTRYWVMSLVIVWASVSHAATIYQQNFDALPLMDNVSEGIKNVGPDVPVTEA